MLLETRALGDIEDFQTKFIRVGNEIYIVNPNGPKMFHKDLAEKDKILERIEDLKSQNPDTLDAGLIFVSAKLIRIGDVSSSLGLPLTPKARKNTVSILKKQYPSFSIKDLAEE